MNEKKKEKKERPRPVIKRRRLPHGNDDATRSPVGPGTPYANEKIHFKALENHLGRATSMAQLAEPHKSITGEWKLPYVVAENQCGKHKRGASSSYEQEDFQRIAYEVMWRIHKNDELLRDDYLNLTKGEPLAPRRSLFALKKWLLARDTTGSTKYETAAEARKRREEHKEKAEEALKLIIERFLHTEDLRAVYDALAERGLNRHDVADALLLALDSALRWYAAHAQEVLGKRRPYEDRPDTPVLTLEQRNGGGTIRVLAIDAGTRNLGLCLLELVDVVAPPEGRVGVTAGYDSPPNSRDPEPRFRVLALELIDLKGPWVEGKGHAVVSYSCASKDAALMEPNYAVDWCTATTSSIGTATIDRSKGKAKAKGTATKPKVVESNDERPTKRRRLNPQPKAATATATATTTLSLIREEDLVLY
jgi:hypothetical protein